MSKNGPIVEKKIDVVDTTSFLSLYQKISVMLISYKASCLLNTNLGRKLLVSVTNRKFNIKNIILFVFYDSSSSE
jgi:hypothetical protein